MHSNIGLNETIGNLMGKWDQILKFSREPPSSSWSYHNLFNNYQYIALLSQPTYNNFRTDFIYFYFQ